MSISLHRIQAIQNHLRYPQVIEANQTAAKKALNESFPSMEEIAKGIEHFSKHPPTSIDEYKKYEFWLQGYRYHFIKSTEGWRTFFPKRYKDYSTDLSAVQEYIINFEKIEHDKEENSTILTPWLQRALVTYLIRRDCLTKAEDQLKYELAEYAFQNKKFAQLLQNNYQSLQVELQRIDPAHSIMDENAQNLLDGLIDYSNDKTLSTFFQAINKLEKYLHDDPNAKPLTFKELCSIVRTHKEYIFATRRKLYHGFDFLSFYFTNVDEKIDQLQTKLEKEAQAIYQPGDIQFFNTRKIEQLQLSKTFDLKEWVFTMALGKYSHAKIFIDDSPLTSSYIWITHEISKYQKVHAFSSEVIRIIPAKLLNPKFRKKVINLLGQGDQGLGTQKLQEMYQKAVIEVGKQIKIPNSENRPWKYGPYAILADIIPGGHISITGRRIQNWSQKILTTSSDKLEERFLSKETPNNITCSEFVAKITVVSLTLLNNQLAELLEVSPKTKILGTPFYEKEKLHLLHPSLLYKRLEQYGTVITLPLLNRMLMQNTSKL